jgi:hypothetical protein
MSILSLSSRATTLALVASLAACLDEGPASESEPVGEAKSAVTSPCTLDIQGFGDIGRGWYAIRTDGSVWGRSPFLYSDPAQQILELGTDNVELADMDGESQHMCVLKTNGDVYCWGANQHGQIAGSASPQVDVPLKQPGLPLPATELAVGDRSTCALLNNGAVWCWGGNQSGELGDGTTTDRPMPTEVTAMGTGVTDISIGFWHACALKGGAVFCWGYNEYGEIGNGQFTAPNAPQLTPVSVLTGVRELSAAGFFTCAIKTDNTLWCWGSNASAHLGVGDTTNRNVPTQVTTLSNQVSHVDGGVRSSCATKLDGSVWCWGWQGHGRIGDGSNSTDISANQLIPKAVSGPLGTSGGNLIRVAEGSACTLRTDGGISCWGGITAPNTSGGYLDGANGSTTPVDIDFCALPTISAVNPPIGRATGGSMITLTGTEFSASTQVFFGQPLPQNAATAVSLTNSTTLVATTPSHGFGEVVDVWIVNPTNRRAVLKQSFTFTDPPNVYGAVPMMGDVAGGTQVELNGANFQPGATVTFGGVAATVMSVPDIQHAIVVTPPHPAGVVDITLTNLDGQSSTLAMGFVYGEGGAGGSGATTSAGGATSSGGSGGGDDSAGPGDGCYCSIVNSTEGTGRALVLIALSLLGWSRRRSRA